MDISRASWTNTIGSADLGTVWQDQNFKPEERGFYYALVIEIPTPHWTAYDAARYGLSLPEHIPITVKERAYSSSIWYSP